MDSEANDKDWTRNIQQKFDVVRHEVDEFVSMDTLRYVENQVQTLGETVKGFCSNFLQDFLPPALSIPVYHDAGTVPQEGKFVTETYKKSVTNIKEKYVDANTKLLPSALSNPVNHDAEAIPPKGKFVTETYKKSVTNLKEKYVDTNTKLLPSALSNPVNHDAESVSQKGKFVMETYKKSATDLKEKYVDTNTKLLPSALSNPVNNVAESVPQKEKHETQNSNKPVIIIKENYADIASKRIPKKQDLGHHVPAFDRHNNVKQTMPMPSEGDKQITEAFFPLARDESALVHDNVKTSGVGYIGSEFEGRVAKEKSLCDSNSIGINDETSLFFVTKDDYQNQEITDEAVFTAVDDLRVCSPVKERTRDTFFDDFDRHNNAKQTMPMPFPSEGDKQITEAFFPLARDESALVHDNVKTSGVGYIGSEFEGHVAKEKFLCDSNSIGINNETSLFFLTEDDYQNQEITDEAVFTAVDDLRICSPVKERTRDTFFDDCHCKIIGTPQSYEVECSSFHGCQVAEPTLISSSSSLSNNFYHQSGSYTIPHETENFVNDLTDSVSTVSETPGHADESKIDISDPNMKTNDLSEKSKLNESCVIVDNKLLGSTSCRPRRHRSYKQMIKDAYTKTKRLTKEYELLGILYGDIDNEPVQHEKHSSKFPSSSEITPGNEQSLTEESSDDWELL